MLNIGDENRIEHLEKQVAYKDDQITFLWKLLDYISTAGDLYKPGISEYFKNVNAYCEQRSHVANSNDGITLTVREYSD